ncbi:MAG: serine/threonine protein kinase [Acidobacteria bacterium]|nr:serine/threonine protein kinase [Acidobacteriota bacterium]
MIKIGTTLQQRYLIERQIGQGGMGAVYIATDQRFGSTVAIKETLCMDENFRKAIEREARLLNSLKHFSLPRVSDHFEEADSQFLVMEYIEGDDVASILERDRQPFPVDKVLRWADHLLDALDYLHTQNMPVIHRDIKPQNLKITPKGEIVLLDFGLAKGNPTDASHNTAAKSIFGYSRSYASLEQIQGTGTDPRSDLYSLAATLYHLLTNTPPEDALTRAMAVLSKKDDPLVPAQLLVPEIPDGVAGVLRRAMALDASERPASAAEMRRMLKDHKQYAYFAHPTDAAVTIANAHIGGQQTALMAEGTRPLARSTEAKTAVLPGNISDPTAVRGEGLPLATNVALASSTESPGRGLGYKLGVGLAGALLLCGAVFGGMYLARGSMSGSAPSAETQPPAPPAIANTNAAANTNTNAVETVGNPGNPAANGNRQAAEKNSETAKTSKPANAAKTESNSSASTGSSDSGDIVVTDPDGTTIRVNPNANKMYIPNLPGPNFFPFPPGMDPRRMTPEELKKLRNMYRRQQQMRQQQQGHPRPPSTPHP